MNSKLTDAKAQIKEVTGLVQGNAKVSLALLADIRAELGELPADAA